MVFFRLVIYVLISVVFCECTGDFIRTISDKEYATLPILFHQDNYNDCMLLGDEALYCSISYTLEPLPTNENSTLWNTIQEISSNPYNYRHDILRHGVCVAKTCPDVENGKSRSTLLTKLTKCYDEKYKPLGLRGVVSDLNCDTIELKHPIDWIDVAVGVIFFIYLGLILCATAVDRTISNMEATKYPGLTWKKVLQVFSIPRNWNRLKTIHKTPDVERLRCIQGVRFYNMMLIILAHTLMANFNGLVANTRETENIRDRFPTMFFLSGSLCVSTFYLISGWLIIHGIMTSFEGRKKIHLKTLFLMIINRYARLTPLLTLIVAFSSTWLRFLGNGPNWHRFIGEEVARCRKNWWTNLLYINNYVDPKNMCLHTTWYLALDSQYFGLLLLIIYCIKNYPKCAKWILGSILILTMIYTFIENYIHDFPLILAPTPESLYDMNYTLKSDQWQIQYCSFSANLQGPLIGLLFGNLYYKYKERKLFTKKVHIYVWWIVVNGLGYGIVVIPGMIGLSKHFRHDLFWSSIYTAVSRATFGFAIGFLLFGVTQGIGSVMKRTLEWPPLYVLGRLTYSAYLVHFPLLLLRAGLNRHPFYINDITMAFDYFGNVVVTYFAATVLTLCFEMPLSQLLKLLLPKMEERTNKTDKQH